MKRGHFVQAGAAAIAAGSLVAKVLGAPSAVYHRDGSSFSLASDGIACSWTTDGGSFRMVALQDRIGGEAIPLPREIFSLTLADGSARAASAFRILRGPLVERIAGRSAASKLADRIASTVVTVELQDPTASSQVTWRAVASDGANYLRQEVTIAAIAGPLKVREVRLIDFPHLPDATVTGLCDGSPVTAGTIFFAIEHPFAQADAIYDRASIDFPCKVDILPGIPQVLSSVIGATSPGQLRRDFLTYLERERAHPYRTFLHYNSWYDIGYFTRYDQADCLSRIHAFGQALHAQREVTLKSFLFDDGWDDPNELWNFNSGFPNGFEPLKAAAAIYGAKPGAWLSPWGGYGAPREARLAAARREGYEIDQDGLALSGPKYYELFHSVVMRFIERGGVNQFKVDGTGDSATVYSGSRFGSNFAAAIALINDMRAAEPDIYVNLTTGTYPSPFWLRYCDSIWRGGEDHDFAGVGSHRQRWITYRDADTYVGVVSQGPLYPVNSLMLHGMIFAQHALHLNDDPHGDFSSEIRSYFGSGTQLQEMYITPDLLSEQNWDDLAAAAKWSARNADVLRDTHWIGGNPERLDVYGWASWSPRKGIIVLRNPSDRSAAIELDPGQALELPSQAPTRYAARNLWHSAAAPLGLRAGRLQRFNLAPFEVATFELTPEGSLDAGG